MDRSEVHNGSIVHASDGVLVKVREVGQHGELYYYAILYPNGDGIKDVDPFNNIHGSVEYAYPATPEEKLNFERWIIQHT